MTRIALLLVPERVFLREDPPDNQRNGTTDEEGPGDDPPRDVVPWLVFGLPHQWTGRVPDTVGN